MLLLALIASVWLIVALMAVALCAYARRCDDELAGAEQPTVARITSAA